MRVRRVVRGLFFMGKQIAAVHLVIYSTNWVERLNHCYCLPCSCAERRIASLRGYLLCAVDKERKTTFCISVSG